MSHGYIPWRDILEYAAFHEIDDEMFPTFNFVIREMDHAFLAWHAKQKPAGKQETAPVDEDTEKVADKGEVAPRRSRRDYGRAK